MTQPGAHTDLAEAFAVDGRTAFILADGRGYIRFWNQAAETLFGHAADEVAGQRVDLVVPPELRAMHWAGFERVIGSTWAGHPGWGDIDALHKSGETVALQVLLTPLTDANGVVGGVFAMFRRRGASAD